VEEEITVYDCGRRRQEDAFEEGQNMIGGIGFWAFLLRRAWPVCGDGVGTRAWFPTVCLRLGSHTAYQCLLMPGWAASLICNGAYPWGIAGDVDIVFESFASCSPSRLIFLDVG